MKSYAEVKPANTPMFPEAEQVDIASVLNQELVIDAFGALPSAMAEGREFSVVRAVKDGKTIKFNCGEVVLKQLRLIEKDLPIRATISREKGKRYYTLS